MDKSTVEENFLSRMILVKSPDKTVIGSSVSESLPAKHPSHLSQRSYYISLAPLELLLVQVSH